MGSHPARRGQVDRASLYGNIQAKRHALSPAAWTVERKFRPWYVHLVGAVGEVFGVEPSNDNDVASPVLVLPAVHEDV